MDMQIAMFLSLFFTGKKQFIPAHLSSVHHLLGAYIKLMQLKSHKVIVLNNGVLRKKSCLQKCALIKARQQIKSD